MDDFVNIPQPSRFRIGQLFLENNFTVPVYQRNYSWTSTELRDFWSDLTDIIDESRKTHFFGQVVTYSESNNDSQDIIDGQQRITTSSLFMAAMMKIVNEMLHKKRDVLSEDSQDTLRDIRNTIKKNLGLKPGNRISLVVEENDEKGLQGFYEKLLDGKTDNIDKKKLSDPKKNMLVAFETMKKYILLKSKENINNIIDQVDMLEKINNSFLDKFYVVMISSPTQQDAFIIFETLNSRGKDLKASDIIKNHLLYLMKDKLEEANDKWNQISAVLNEDSARITRFIRTYWAAKHKVVNEKNLYRTLSSSLREESDAEEFLNDLLELVDLYNVIEKPNANRKTANYFNNYELNKQVNILAKLKVLTYYPIMLAMKKRKYTESEQVIVLNKVLAIFIRHQTIMSLGTNKLEIAFSNVAVKIYEHSYPQIDGLIQYIDQLNRTDNEVSASLQILSKESATRGPKKWSLMYLLTDIYDNIYNDIDYYEEAFNEDKFKLIQIGNGNENISDEYINYLGNWTFIEDTSKYDVSDDKQVRINMLKGSKLRANQELGMALEQGWTEERIQKRQQMLANEALQIWR